MSDLIRNPEDRFSHNKAHLLVNSLTYIGSAYLRRVVSHTCYTSVILLEISLSWTPLAGHVDWNYGKAYGGECLVMKLEKKSNFTEIQKW